MARRRLFETTNRLENAIAAAAIIGVSTPAIASGMAATLYEGPGYTATKDHLLARLKRIEGQVRGISRMVEDERYCIDVLTQISAAQAALAKVALGLVDDHARHCVVGAEPEQQQARTAELMGAVGRLVTRR